MQSPNINRAAKESDRLEDGAFTDATGLTEVTFPGEQATSPKTGEAAWEIDFFVFLLAEAALPGAGILIIRRKCEAESSLR